MLEFRLLNADEIECRIATVGSWGVQLLLYKDARCDMNILDETVGPMNWQRRHNRDNANCVVSIWDGDKKQWIEKEDCGTESFTEKEKGLASDSFKRACFNIGIGRELYTSPTMFVKAANLKTLEEKNGKWTCRDYFEVTDITYTGRKIESVTILNTKTGEELMFSNAKHKTTTKGRADSKSRYTRQFMEENGNKPIDETAIKELRSACKKAGGNFTIESAVRNCKKNDVKEISFTQFRALMACIDKACMENSKAA